MCANIAATLTSKKQDWETPQELFDLLNEEFEFTLDVAANATNAKCPNYYSPEIDGLLQDWGNNICFMNPPYGSAIRKWVAKAHQEAMLGATVVCLVPARTDTEWWWTHCTQGEIRFLKGRLTFSGYGTAPFPSAVVIFHPPWEHFWDHTPYWWDWKNRNYR